MDKDKSITLMAIICIIMFFITIWILTISVAYINSPSEFTIRFEIENGTQEVIKGLNGSIVINNYYGNHTKEITLCKDKVTNLYVIKEKGEIVGEIVGEDTWENVYECDLEEIKNE